VVLGGVVGQSVQRIAVHQPMWLPQTGVQCYGAVTLWFDASALVLRSPLRYGKPRLAQALRPSSFGRPAATLCSHEEAHWLMQAIGPAWCDKPKEWRRLTAICANASALRLEGKELWPQWLTYREDLDAAWLWTAAVGGHDIGVIQLAGPQCVFGWLHPDAPYGLNWDGRQWPTLQTVWACAKAATPLVRRDRLFRRLYRLRLEQHPNLLRRFAALHYPVNCVADAWLTSQIGQVRSALSATR
jgi:hypothetical protein